MTYNELAHEQFIPTASIYNINPFLLEISDTEKINIPITNLTEEIFGNYIKIESPIPNRYYGYVINKNRLSPLPNHSKIDPITGYFSWQPNPGENGEYIFIFITKNEKGRTNIKKIAIRVKSKFKEPKQYKSPLKLPHTCLFF